jgi:multicomponent K+:H+ antiporter subunit E
MSALAKLLPAPLLSAALVLLWLGLQRSTSPGQLFLGLALALVVPLVTTTLRPARVRVRRPLLAAGFIMTVCYDVLASSCQVAWSLIAWRWRQPRARFVVIPLELRDPLGLAGLAMVTTIVPGTVWSELALDRSALMLHVWDVEDERDFIAHFKARYERPLVEIFQ